MYSRRLMIYSLLNKKVAEDDKLRITNQNREISVWLGLIIVKPLTVYHIVGY